MESYEVCEQCDGTGRIYTEFDPDTGEDIREVTYQEYLSLSPDVRNIEQCPQCKGEGYTPVPYRDRYTERL
jgi:RecJ-like exonuclease